MDLGELSRVVCVGHTGHLVWAVATGLVLLQQVAIHQPLQVCPGPWALRSPGSERALLIPVTHLLESSHNPLLKQVSPVGASWTELCCWPPVNTHTALYPAGTECLSNLTRLSWCPSAQHNRVWTSPTLCKVVQDPDQQQPHQMDPLAVIIVTLCGRS